MKIRQVESAGKVETLISNVNAAEYFHTSVKRPFVSGVCDSEREE
jgi:hypothetical protein